MSWDGYVYKFINCLQSCVYIYICICSSLRNKTYLIYLALIHLHWFGATTTCQPFISRWHLDHIWSFYCFTFDEVRVHELVRRLDSVEMAAIKIMSKLMMYPWKMMDFFQLLLDVGCEAMWSNLKDKGTDEKNKNQKHVIFDMFHATLSKDWHLSARAADWSRDDFTHFLGPLKGCQLTKGGNATRGTFLLQIEVK